MDNIEKKSEDKKDEKKNMLYRRELIDLSTEEGKWIIEFAKGCLNPVLK